MNSRISKVRNAIPEGKPKEKRDWLTVRNSADGPAEILIYSDIGTNWWSEESADAQWIRDQLSTIPKTQPINLRINSRGGNVWDGLVMYNLLRERSQYVTTYIDGLAASIASVVALAGSKVIIPKNGMIMIHDPSCYCEGTEREMLSAAELLKATKSSLVSVYLEETNLSESDLRSKMELTTWMTGQEALDNGFATDLVDSIKVAACGDLSIFRNVPKIATTTENTTTDDMKPKNLLLDPAAGGTAGGGGAATPPANQTPANPTASAAATAQASEIANLRAQFDIVSAQLAKERQNSIEKTIDGLISEGRVLASSKEFWVSAALKDEAVIAQLRQHQAVQLPTDDIRPLVDVVKASITDIGKEMDRLRAPQASFLKGNGVSVGDRIASANAAANFHRKNRDRLMEVMNANTIGSGLKRQVLLQEIMRAFARQLMPLKAFSSVFSGIPLEGTNVVEIPYFPLVSTASTDWNASNGYVMGDSTQNTKNVTVNKRKYQPIRFTSDELARQPALNLLKIGEAKAEKLAADVFADVLSLVTVANYGATPTTGAASSFDLADILTLKGVADGNTVNWPKVGRSIVVQSAVDLNILTQSGVQSALNFGSADPVQNGSVKKIFGFDYYMCDFVPANGEQLLGFITYMSAILFAGSPIGPADEVRAQLSAYEVVTDPQTGASFEYRLWGNPDMDERRQVIECNYGYAVGESAALKRIAVV